MPFHIEISHSIRRARAFNLSEQDLNNTILQPWLRRQLISLGDRKWDPTESDLKILEGPTLTGPDLAMSQGWVNAERKSADVTTRFIQPDHVHGMTLPITVVAFSDEVRQTLTGLLSELAIETFEWDIARARILATRSNEPNPNLGFAALVAIGGDQTDPAALVDAGLALGALGDLAVVVQIGLTGVNGFDGVRAERFDPAEASSVESIAKRLRAVRGE